jgi:hypothetical protein
MYRTREEIKAQLLRRALVGAIAFWVTLTVGVQIARSAELVPSIGWMRLTGEAESKSFGNLALRGNMLPVLKSEIAVGYRNEERIANQLDVRMVPVTTSLYLAPVPAIYAGGGVGWYHTTFDYSSSVPLADRTSEEFGVHLGGGVQVPLAPSASVDLGGRYVMMREQDSHLIPERFDPDFWVTTLGLAIHF